jgi:hypothetical protein
MRVSYEVEAEMTDEQLNARFDGLARLIQDLIARINDKVDAGFHDMTTRFDTQAARLEKQDRAE